MVRRPEPVRSCGGFTLAEILVVATALGILLTLLVPAFSRTGRRERLLGCISNLKALHAGQQAYYAVEGADRSLRGTGLWNTLVGTGHLAPEALSCPLVEDPDECTYLGPAREVPGMDPNSLLACDDRRNHGEGRTGGNLLYASGRILTDHGKAWREGVRALIR